MYLIYIFRVRLEHSQFQPQCVYAKSLCVSAMPW